MRGHGWITAATRLSDDVLALVGTFPAGDDLVATRDGAVVESRCRTIARTEGGADIDLLTLRVPRDADGVVIAVGADEVAVDAAANVDVRSFARDGLAWADADTRQRALDFLVDTPASWPATSGVRLSASLRLLRDALREPLPPAVVHPDVLTTGAVDGIYRIDDAAVYVKGWLRSSAAPPETFTAVSPEGIRVELADRLWRHARPDVVEGLKLGPRADAPGFAVYVELPCASPLGDGWLFELRDAAGNACEMPGPTVTDDPSAVRDVLLNDVDLDPLTADELLRGHVAPALTRMQTRRDADVHVVEVLDFGTPPTAPDVSIIVPLYRRVDLVEFQLAQLADDPDMRHAELLYVLDSPELEADLRRQATSLYDLYRLPFRVAVLSENGGFATANNRGASVARGRLLLFLNSDVFPDRPGWLSQLCTLHDTTPDAGAVGPKLLYEDDSIQHAGLYFHRPPGGGVWSNEHYFKGLHRTLPAANVSRPVPALTAACLLVAKERFDEVGGFSGTYVHGDYEDSDLCLRLRRAGYASWYAASVELYHLEGQSYGGAERERMSRYNRWLHSETWGSELDAPTAQPQEPVATDGETQEGRAAKDAPRSVPPTITPQLTALVERALALPYTSESGEERILTGNHYQSLLLGGRRTSGFRSERDELLSRLRFDGRTVLDLGCNLGEISREARARGATLVDGFEYDPFFVELAQAVNAANGIARVSFYRRDVTDRSVYTQPYDIVLALSVWVYVRDVIDRLAEITRDVLVVETHKLDGNLESEYLEPISAYFPYYTVLGDTEWAVRSEDDHRRAVLAFAKSPEALVAVVREPNVRLARPRADDAELRYVDPSRTPWCDAFFSTFAFGSATELFEAVEAIEIDVDAIAGMCRDAAALSTWAYWLLFVKGYLQYKAGVADEGNVYVDYLTRYFGPHGGDPGLGGELTEPARAAARAEERFRTTAALERSARDGAPEIAPIVVASRAWPSNVAKAVYEVGSSTPIQASLLDGYHRLFSARLLGIRQLPARIVVQHDAELPPFDAHVEEFALDGKLVLRGSTPTAVDAVEIWSADTFVARAAVRPRADGNGAGAAGEFDVSVRWPDDADPEDIRVVGTVEWRPVAAGALADLSGAGVAR